MHIYIDESGSFIVPTVKKPKVSCVAALVLPSSKHDEILDGFFKIRSSWGLGVNEIKGNKLQEIHVAEVISFLNDYDVFVEICATDTGSQTEQQVTDYKKYQAVKIIENLTPNHYPDAVNEMHQLKDSFLKLSTQLVPQFIATILLITRLLESATIYYSERLPEELGGFHWIIDGKDTKVTNYEKLWTTLILPMSVQMGPLLIYEEGDYSYFERFNKTLDKTPDYLKLSSSDPDAPFEGPDYSMIMQESFKFGDSKRYAGLQLADIVASAFTRAMNRTLDKSGWQNLGALMIKRREETVRIACCNWV